MAKQFSMMQMYHNLFYIILFWALISSFHYNEIIMNSLVHKAIFYIISLGEIPRNENYCVKEHEQF